jgi:hypothetical protein
MLDAGKGRILEAECIQDILVVASVAEPTRETGAGRRSLEGRTKRREHVTAELIATQLVETRGEAYRNSSIHETKLEFTQLIENKQSRSLQIDTERNFSDEKVNTTVRGGRG